MRCLTPTTANSTPAAKPRKRQRSALRTICEWDARGWLLRAAENPIRYTAQALDAAAAKSDQARREGALKARHAAREKTNTLIAVFRSGKLYTRRDAAKRQKCCVATIIEWEDRGWLTRAGDNPIHYTENALDAAAAKAAKADQARREASKKTIIAARKKSLEKRCPKPREEECTAKVAAGLGGVSVYTIYRLNRASKLPKTSEKPLRFDRKVVSKYFDGLTKDDGDLAIIDIPARLPGPDDKAKQKKVRDIIKQLRIKPYRRRMPGKSEKRRILCVREERFDEIKAEWLAMTTFAGDELRPDEIKLKAAAAEYLPDQHPADAARALKELLAKHAPGCMRIVKVKGSGAGRGRGARYTTRVIPRRDRSRTSRGGLEPAGGNANPAREDSTAQIGPA